MKKKKHNRALADPDALSAARRVIAEARERRKTTDDDGVRVIKTGVPRPGDGIDWPEWRPLAKPYFPLGAGFRAPQPKPRVAEPPAPPTQWNYVWVQTRAPTERDPGAIIDGQYAVAGDVLLLSDVDGNPIASQKLRKDGNAPALARRLLKEKWCGRSAVPGFYDSPSFNPSRTFH